MNTPNQVFAMFSLFFLLILFCCFVAEALEDDPP